MSANDYIKVSLVSALFIGIGIAIPLVKLDIVTALAAVTFAFIGGLLLGMLLIRADEEDNNDSKERKRTGG